MASFFTADERWEKLREFTLMDMDDGLGRGPCGDGERDSGADHPQQPRPADLPFRHVRRPGLLPRTDRDVRDAQRGLLSARDIRPADAPDQYDPSKTATAGEGSIFDEVMGEFNDFEGDDNYDDEY